MSEPVYLRALELEDIERTVRWHNDPELYLSLAGTFRYVSKSSERDWIEKKVAYSSTETNLAICESATDRHVGNIYLRNICWVARRGNMEVCIGEKDSRSKGYGKSAIMQLIQYAFDELGLQKICLSALSDNSNAKVLYEKCGFVTEGVLRRHVFKNGCFKDIISMGLHREPQGDL